MAEFETYPVTEQEPVLSDNALKVLHSRYLIKDRQGQCIETPAELFSRTALSVAKIEARYGENAGKIKHWHRKYYELMTSLKFLPNSPALMNANRRGTLSACFVLPIEDSIEGIFEAVKQTALIQQAGGGTGFSFDKLRPSGDYIASSGTTTSGPISFWRVFCETTNAIQQGSFRRGANMGMMSLEHPDVLKFLNAKQKLKAFTNFNISVKITDKCVERIINAPKELHIVTNPHTQQRYLIPKKLKIADYSIQDLYELADEKELPKNQGGKFFTVGDIWKKVVTCARNTGEPGLVFIDRINRDNPTPILGDIEATNPCGEQPLLAFEACTLGSINLSKFVCESEDRLDIDWPALADTVVLAVRFLDNIIDAGVYPVRETVQLVKANRKIGLGVMGFADCLFMLGIPYNSQQAVDFAERVMGFINENARKASGELADMRGPFPNWNNSTWRTVHKKKVRNASITCIAPTGTISIIADCSAGIEPLYSLAFIRRILDGSEMLQVSPVFKKIAEKRGFYSKKLVDDILRTGSIQRMTKIPKSIRSVFKCAYDVKPQWHIQMQAAFQKHCDAAVSKTINLDEKATATTVDQVYKSAYELGCKGVTVYRRNSRADEPMSLE